jgi:parallel beta-helix repeat protein
VTSQFTKYSHMKTHLLIPIALFLLQTYSFSQTPVPGGYISGTWTRDGSPYDIQGSIMIADGNTLVIEPGVTVNFKGMYKLLVAGRLLAVGTETDSIFFTASDPGNGWRGIRFDNTPETNDTSMIMYCRLEYGRATGPSPDDKGGAVYFSHFSNALISNSVIADGSASLRGGAIFCEYSSPIISNNTITRNTAYWSGGGISFENSSSPLISHNTISYNSTLVDCSFCDGGGGGIYCVGGNAIISDNVITHNSTRGTLAGGGGGIYLIGSQIVVTRNIISFNSTSTLTGGGGIYCTESNPVISYNTISNNASLGNGGGGGGICVYYSASPVISNNTITNNSASSFGGGLFVSGGNSAINSNTIANNHSAMYGGGTYFTTSANPILLNCILWGNTAGVSGNQVFLNDEPSDPSFIYSDVQDGSSHFGLNGNFYMGTYQNNISSDPLFISPTSESGADFDGVKADWSLACASSCINAGYPSGVYPPSDKAGNPRVSNGMIDLGAFEFQISAGLVFSVSTDSLFLSPSASNSQTFEISSNVSWTASDDQSWLTLDKTSGPCNAIVTVSAGENPAAETRTATITISGTGASDQFVTVVQEAPVLKVSSDNLSIASDNNSTTTFNITSNINWTLTSDQSWLTASKLNGTGNSAITLSATKNPDITVRTAIVKVSGTGVPDQIITVSQQAAAPLLIASTHTLSLAAADNSIKKFNIISNTRWNAVSDKTWLTVNPSDSTGNAEITVTAAANPLVTARTAAITLSGNDVPDWIITVTQTASEPFLTVSTHTISFFAPASTETFDILSNISWNVTTDQPWLVPNPTLGADSATITLTAEDNKTGAERTATVFVAGNNVETQLISVTQDVFFLDIKGTTTSEKIIAFPNPTSGQLTISLDASLNDEYLIEVMNDLGDVVLMTKQPKNAKTIQIDLSGYSSGLYLVRISSKKENYRMWVSKK